MTPTTRCTRIASSFCLVLASCSTAGEVSPRAAWAETVQRDTESMVRALYAGEFATVIDFTAPAIVESLGGRERALAIVDEAMSAMLKKGLRLESFAFPRPPEFVETEQAVFAIVPTLMVAERGGQRVESLNYQFGVLVRGQESWRYAEGSRISQDNVRSLFPSFPDDYRFPQIYRRRI